MVVFWEVIYRVILNIPYYFILNIHFLRAVQKTNPLIKKLPMKEAFLQREIH